MNVASPSWAPVQAVPGSPRCPGLSLVLGSGGVGHRDSLPILPAVAASGLLPGTSFPAPPVGSGAGGGGRPGALWGDVRGPESGPLIGL